MANKRPKDLTSVTAPAAGDRLLLDGATTRSVTWENFAVAANHVFATKTAAMAYEPDVAPDYLRIEGYSAAGDGGAALYKKISTPSPAKAWHFQSADDTWWELAETEVLFYQLGAVGDGVADDYPAVLATVEYAKQTGAVVTCGDGAFKIDMSVALRASIVLEHMTIRGCGANLWESTASPTTDGTWFLIVGTVASPFSLRNRVDFSDVTFFWPEQVDPASLIAYPYAINSVSPIFCRLHDIVIINAYHGINITTPNGFNRIERVKITAFKNSVRGETAAADLYIHGCLFTYGIGYNYYAHLDELDAYVEAIAFGGSTGVLLPGEFYDDWHIDHNDFFALTNGINITCVTGSDAHFWGTISSNLFDACLTSITFGGVSIPRPAIIADNLMTGQTQGTSFSGANILIASTSDNVMELIVDGNQLVGGKRTTVAVTAPNITGGTLLMTGNTLRGMGINGEVASQNFGLYVDAPTLDVGFNDNRVDGIAVNSVLKAGVNVAAAKSLVATGNNLINLDGGFNCGTISGHLVAVANAAQSVGVPLAPGTVSGSKIDMSNSWNPSKGYKAGRYYTGVTSGGVTNSASLIANTVYFFPFVVDERHTFDRIAIEVGTAGTAANIRMAVYTAVNGVPATLVADGGSLAVSGTGMKTSTISASLAPGMYYLAVVLDGTETVASVGATTGGTMHYNGVTAFIAADAQMTASMTFGAFPATAFTGAMGSVAYASAATPVIGLRAA